MRYRTNTNERKLREVGNCNFRIDGVDLKSGKNNPSVKYYQWLFMDDSGVEFKKNFFPGRMGDLLRALGCNEVAPDDFDWESDDVVGKTINCDIEHELDKKGEPQEILTNIKLVSKQSIPAPSAVKEEDIQWDKE